MTRVEPIVRRRRQRHLPMFDIHYRRPLIGAVGSKLVGVGPPLLSGRFTDWLPPIVSRQLGRFTLRLGDRLLARSRPLYSFDRSTWYVTREWARRFEVEGHEAAVSTGVATTRQTEFDEAGEALARAEASAKAIGWRITHVGRYAPDDEVIWEATARGANAVNHHHGEGATARAAIEELIDRLRRETDARTVDTAGAHHKRRRVTDEDEQREAAPRDLSGVLACPLCQHWLAEPGRTARGRPLPLPAPDAVRAIGVTVDDQWIVVDLGNGAKVSVPTAWSSRLAAATPAQRADVEISADGESLHWAQIDEDLGVSHLLGIPEDMASSAHGDTIYPPPPSDDVAEHVGALVLTMLRAEEALLRSEGVRASASLLRRGTEVTVALELEASQTQEPRTLVVTISLAGRLVAIEVKIIDDQHAVIAQVARAMVGPLDLAPVALSFTRAGTARLGTVRRA